MWALAQTPWQAGKNKFIESQGQKELSNNQSSPKMQRAGQRFLQGGDVPFDRAATEETKHCAGSWAAGILRSLPTNRPL